MICRRTSGPVECNISWRTRGSWSVRKRQIASPYTLCVMRNIAEPTAINLVRYQGEQIRPHAGTHSDPAKSVKTDLRSERLTGRLCHTQMDLETSGSGNTRHSVM